MSGGSYDYFYGRVTDAANEVVRRHPNSPKHLALAAKLRHLSTVMYTLEWADSGDTLDEPALQALDTFIAPAEELDAARVFAEQAKEMLEAALARCKP